MNATVIGIVVTVLACIAVPVFLVIFLADKAAIRPTTYSLKPTACSGFGCGRRLRCRLMAVDYQPAASVPKVDST